MKYLAFAALFALIQALPAAAQTQDHNSASPYFTQQPHPALEDPLSAEALAALAPAAGEKGGRLNEGPAGFHDPVHAAPAKPANDPANDNAPERIIEQVIDRTITEDL